MKKKYEKNEERKDRRDKRGNKTSFRGKEREKGSRKICMTLQEKQKNKVIYMEEMQ